MSILQSKEKVEHLKANWRSDPCWDIEETEGFEAHYDELLAYRLEAEAKWKQEQFDEVERRGTELRCSFELAEYIIGLERRLSAMNEALETIYYR